MWSESGLICTVQYACIAWSRWATDCGSHYLYRACSKVNWQCFKPTLHRWKWSGRVEGKGEQMWKDILLPGGVLTRDWGSSPSSGCSSLLTSRKGRALVLEETPDRSRETWGLKFLMFVALFIARQIIKLVWPFAYWSMSPGNLKYSCLLRLIATGRCRQLETQ